ncbi:MAG: hypothetical protein AVDCRST_MAG93-306 [uncultured Chloroflexia bacterium]|uniref:Nitroreductase family deazaflavin-dependent oxidoreductase n=1 Tax=uncultured Chloroflexia bacterium TaxID=1672391 RepID=A0A6J4HAD0_9CHLR|nr:MAG: hypothetical protein AVDCRST_MAG93-306 [uncultured Chloroflexia bacterium]
MSPNQKPPVEGAEPPEKLAKVVNPVIKALLRSPLHRLVSKHLMLLTFAGRKTGRTYTIVVGRHKVGGKLVVPLGTTGRRWRLNLRRGAPVVVTMEGRHLRGRGELVEDPEEAARVYELLLDRIGLKNARRLGLRVNVDRRPTEDELKDVLAGRGVVRIELYQPQVWS